MVYKGRPSSGCENCRKSKKACDEKFPTCGRCNRLGKACGGYRDVPDLIFKNETGSVARRASAHSESGAAYEGPSSGIRQSTPEIQNAATKFFFEQIVTPSHLSYLEGVAPSEFLLKPVMACALMAMANQDDDNRQRQIARGYYVEAITATNTALRHPTKVKEDDTLIAVCLLSTFELITWEKRGPSSESWRQHLKGAAQVLRLRGPSQIQTKTGAVLFRDLRVLIINNCEFDETEVPDYIIPWTQALEHDELHTPADQLSILSTRLANLRAAFRASLQTDQALSELAAVLEKDLLDWSESTLAAGSICSFHSVHDPDSPHSWNAIRHEYGIPQAQRSWNVWRCNRISLSRLQEAIWRRFWPTLTQPSIPVPSSDHFNSIRTRMVNDICISAACTLGNSAEIEIPTKSAVSSGILSSLPLVIAGTCLLEQLSRPIVSHGGSRMILADVPLHENPLDPASVQLAWIIERLEYIGTRVGVKWASQCAGFLRGEKKFYYDLERSRVVTGEDFDA